VREKPKSELDIEVCKTFVYANRLIADRFRAKAEEVIEAAQQVEDIDTRLRLADLSVEADRRAAYHQTLADMQENDMGVACHCPPRNQYKVPQHKETLQ